MWNFVWFITISLNGLYNKINTIKEVFKKLIGWMKFKLNIVNVHSVISVLKFQGINKWETELE